MTGGGGASAQPSTPGQLEGGNNIRGGNGKDRTWSNLFRQERKTPTENPTETKTKAALPPGELIGWKTLDIRTWVTIMVWKLRHRNLVRPPDARPRASWAQLLYALGIADVKALKGPKPYYVDADTIPDSIDVAVQRVRIHELGRIALILGFHKVQVDIKNP